MRITGNSLYQRCARSLISIYPVAWRERYAEEMLLLLEDVPPTFRTLFNLFMSLFDAYLHRRIVQGRMPPMLQKIRSNELVIYVSTFFFFVAWLVAQRYTVTPNQPKTLLSGFSSVHASPFLSITSVVFFILLLFFVLGGLPILFAACWKALRTRNFRALLFCLLGLIGPCVIVFFATSVLGFLESTALHGVAATCLALFIFFSGLSLSLALIVLSVQSVAPSRRITHYGFYLATPIPVFMLVGFVALLLSVIPSFASTLSYYGDDAVFYATRQVLMLLVMLVTFFFSLIALKRGFQARKAVQVSAQEEAAVM